MAKFTDSRGNVIYSSRKDAKPVLADTRRTAAPESTLSGRLKKSLAGISDWYRSSFSCDAPGEPAQWSRDVKKRPSLAQYEISNRLAELGIFLAEKSNTEYMRCRVYGDMSACRELRSDLALCDELKMKALAEEDPDAFLSRHRDELAYLYEKYRTV